MQTFFNDVELKDATLQIAGIPLHASLNVPRKYLPRKILTHLSRGGELQVNFSSLNITFKVQLILLQYYLSFLMVTFN